MTDPPNPPGFHAITPYLLVDGLDDLVPFLTKAFGAQESYRLNRPDGSIMHIEMRVGDSALMMGEPMEGFGPMPSSLYLYVDVKVDGSTLLVFYTVVGENPERILLSRIDLAQDWMDWEEGDPVVVLEPAVEWEGSAHPEEPSVRGAALEPVRQLRDPALFKVDGRSYLLYSMAGEQGIAIARVHWN